MTQDEKKQAVAKAALEFVEAGTAVGIGTGSTANYFIDALAEVKHKVDTTVASSEESARRLRSHGIPVTDLNNVAELSGRLRLLGEDERVADRLVELLREVPAAGKQIHDANVVATMLVHGVDTLVTADASHFRRYGVLLRVLDLATVAP